MDILPIAWVAETAMAFLRKIARETECIVCHETMVRPKVVPCGHAFCQKASLDESRLKKLNSLDRPANQADFLRLPFSVYGSFATRIQAVLLGVTKATYMEMCAGL